jgi:hypothetical protein
MMSFLRVLLSLAVLLPIGSPIVFAQSGQQPYIEINNGIVVTNPGQTPQVTWQIGNRSTTLVENVGVFCDFSGDLGGVAAVYPGPFSSVQAERENGRLLVEVGTRVVLDEQGTHDNVDLPPGQNYNVSFNLHIQAPSGTQRTGGCSLVQLVPTEGGYEYVILSTATTTVRVQ